MSARRQTGAGREAPRGQEVNRQAIADFYGVAPATVSAWVKRGMPYRQAGRKGQEWLFDTAMVAEWREEQRAASEHGDSEKWDLDEARRRKEAAGAALAELELAKARSRVVDVEAVTDIVADDYSRVRSRLLSMPAKLAPEVYRAESMQEVRRILDEGIREPLNELSGTFDGPAGEGASGDASEDAEATSEADRQ